MVKIIPRNLLKKTLSISIAVVLGVVLLLGSEATMAKSSGPGRAVIAMAKHYVKGEYGKAIEVGEREIAKQNRKGPITHNPFWSQLGASYYRNGQYDKAISALEKSADRKSIPSIRLSSYFYLGRAYTDNGDYDEAIRWHSKGLELRPALHFYLERAESYLFKGMYDEALADVDRGLETLDPKQNPIWARYTHFTRAFSHLGLGETDAALSMISKAEEAYPDYDPELHLGLIYYAVGDEQKLIELFGDEGWLGVEVANYSKKSLKAIMVRGLVKAAPAERGGLQEGDLIIRMNGSPVQDIIAFTTRIGSMAPGSNLRLYIRRGKEEKEININLGSKNDKAARALLASDRLIAAFLAKKGLYELAEKAESNGNYRKAFRLYREASHADSDIVKRIIKLYNKLDPPPLLPTGVQFLFEQAQREAAAAEDDAGYDRAMDTYREAIRIAPWISGLHWNLALLAEQRGLYRTALEQYRLAELAATDPEEVREASEKVFGMEFALKRGDER